MATSKPGLGSARCGLARIAAGLDRRSMRDGARRHDATDRRHLAEICGSMRIPLIFKASFDKANRTSGSSFRGPGLGGGHEGLRAGQGRDRLAGDDRHPRDDPGPADRRDGRFAPGARVPGATDRPAGGGGGGRADRSTSRRDSSWPRGT